MSVPESVTIRSIQRPTAPDLRAVIRLAVPVATVQVGLMGMGVVDTIMVGHFSAADLAAVALGNLYFFLIAVFGLGSLMALDPLVAQAVGAGDQVGIARAVQRGLLLACGLTALATLALAPAGGIFSLLRQPDEVVPIAGAYTRALIPGLFPFFAFVVFRQSLQAMARLAPIVWTVAITNGLNVLLNWVLIYGNLGAPRLGAVGSGWGTALSRWAMALLLLTVAWPLLRPYLRPLRRDAARLRPLGRMVRLGAPIGMHFQVQFGSFAIVGIMMGWLGTEPMAGHQVALNLAALAFMIPLGISASASILVGQAVGRGDPDGARRAGSAALLIVLVFTVGTAIVFLSAPELLARAYTRDAGVLAIAIGLLPIAGAFQVFDGFQTVAAGVLRGVGDTRLPMIANLVGFWGLGLPIGASLTFAAGFGPSGLWWGLAAGLGAVAFLLLLRIRIRFGRDLRRLVMDADEDLGVAGDPGPARGTPPISPPGPARRGSGLSGVGP